jgi:hypothetical protein
MTDLCGTVIVDAPYSVAMDAVLRRLKTVKNRLMLNVPFSSLGIPSSFGIEREVEVDFVPFRGHKGERLLHDELKMRWTPIGGGPLPTFNGSLKMHPEGGKTELVLAGEYEPPMGKMGEVFDAVIGKRIAEATAQALLHQLKENIEADFLAVKETIEETPRGV